MLIEIIGLFFAGILAGEEFIVRYGVQPALAALPQRESLLARQSLIRRLRFWVPGIMLPTVALAITLVALRGVSPGTGFRWAGLAALALFLVVSFAGTVPINIRINDWNVDELPLGWERTIGRWQTIDIFRSSAALLAFGLFLIAAAMG